MSWEVRDLEDSTYGDPGYTIVLIDAYHQGLTTQAEYGHRLYLHLAMLHLKLRGR